MTNAADRYSTTHHAPQDVRQAIMIAVSAAVAETHKEVMQKKPEWFWHILAKAERKAERTATQAALGTHSNGTVTFAEVYAKTLPTLFTAALDAYEQALNDNT